MDERLLGVNPLIGLADLLLPRVCVVCGRALRVREECICTECAVGLPFALIEDMERNPMSLRYNERINSACTAYEPFQRAAALLVYEHDTPYSWIPRALKYRRDFVCGRFFARMFGTMLSGSELFMDVDLVIPVPLHWTRRLRRGYNQAEIIAREVAGVLGARLDTALLRRSRRTATQTRMREDEKLRNVSGAFTVSRRHSVPEASHILLIDDVFTSGSTMCACHDALRSVFPPQVRISIATLSAVDV